MTLGLLQADAAGSLRPAAGTRSRRAAPARRVTAQRENSNVIYAYAQALSASRMMSSVTSSNGVNSW
ncbi:MAG: hypothetical protein ACRDYX_13110 [Egibacteraceae bacterium]